MKLTIDKIHQVDATEQGCSCHFPFPFNEIDNSGHNPSNPEVSAGSLNH
jgi:hypothetical protein